MKTILIIACITFITLCALQKEKERIVYQENIRFITIKCHDQVQCIKYVPKEWTDLSSNKKERWRSIPWAWANLTSNQK